MCVLHALIRPSCVSACVVACIYFSAFLYYGSILHSHLHIIMMCFFTIIQGEDLLAACSAGNIAAIIMLLQKGADIHYIGKVKNSVVRKTHGINNNMFLSTGWLDCSSSRNS